MANKEIGIKPCFIPECRSKAEVVKNEGLMFVGCVNCSVQTGSFKTEGMAVGNWNAIPRLVTTLNSTEEALKDLLHFAYTYRGKRTYISVPHYQGALIRVVCQELVENEWVERSNEKIFVREPDWSNNTGGIEASPAIHIYSVLARAQALLLEIESE